MGGVTGLELVQESGGAVINLPGSYRVSLGVGGLRPYGPSRGEESCMLIQVAGAAAS